MSTSDSFYLLIINSYGLIILLVILEMATTIHLIVDNGALAVITNRLNPNVTMTKLITASNLIDPIIIASPPSQQSLFS